MLSGRQESKGTDRWGRLHEEKVLLQTSFSLAPPRMLWATTVSQWGQSPAFVSPCHWFASGFASFLPEWGTTFSGHITQLTAVLGKEAASQGQALWRWDVVLPSADGDLGGIPAAPTACMLRTDWACLRRCQVTQTSLWKFLISFLLLESWVLSKVFSGDRDWRFNRGSGTFFFFLYGSKLFSTRIKGFVGNYFPSCLNYFSFFQSTGFFKKLPWQVYIFLSNSKIYIAKGGG